VQNSSKNNSHCKIRSWPSASD